MKRPSAFIRLIALPVLLLAVWAGCSRQTAVNEDALYMAGAIELYPGFAEAYYNRGMILLGLKDTRKGFLDMSRAGELGIEEAYGLISRLSGIR